MTNNISTTPTTLEYDPEKAREEYNAYQREYRRTHRETIRAINRRYWMRKAEQRAREEGTAHEE